MELPDLTKWICSLSLPSDVRMMLTKEITEQRLDSKKWDSIVRSREIPPWLSNCGVTDAVMANIRRPWVSEFGVESDNGTTQCPPDVEVIRRNSISGRRLSRPSIPDLSLPDHDNGLDPCTVEYDTPLGEWQWTTPIPPRPNGRPGGFTEASERDRNRITAFYRFQGLPDVSDGLVTNELCPRVYCGPMADAACLPLLQALRITHILNLAHEVRCAEELRPFENHSVSYFHQPIHDTVDQVKLCLQEKEFKTLCQATAFIDQTVADPQNRILVHCVQGLSRAPSIVASYMMRYLGYPLDGALGVIRKAHEGACLPFRFEELLRAFEISCAKSRTNPDETHA